MLALLSYLEANQRNRYDNDNDDINSLEYQKALYGPYGNFDVANNDDDDGGVNNGEWWNDWIEPSVQYYNPRGHFDENSRKRLTSTGNLFYTHTNLCLCRNSQSKNFIHFVNACMSNKSLH